MIEIQISVFEMQVSLLPVNGNRQTLCQNDPCTKPFHFVCVCMGGGGGGGGGGVCGGWMGRNSAFQDAKIARHKMTILR